MPNQEHAESCCPVNPSAKSKGDTYEGIAFTFCKAATIILLTQKFALPVASGLAATFYVLAAVHGKKETRCVFKVPLYIAAFWGIVCAASLYFMFRHTPG